LTGKFALVLVRAYLLLVCFGVLLCYAAASLVAVIVLETPWPIATAASGALAIAFGIGLLLGFRSVRRRAKQLAPPPPER